jgi:hypothetical protein
VSTRDVDRILTEHTQRGDRTVDIDKVREALDRGEPALWAKITVGFVAAAVMSPLVGLLVWAIHAAWGAAL